MTQWKKCQSFRTKASWNVHKDYKPTVHRIWREKALVGDKWTNIKRKLYRCQQYLKTWVRKTEHNIELLIRKKTSELAAVQTDSARQNMEAEVKLKDELWLLLEEEDMKCKQGLGKTGSNMGIVTPVPMFVVKGI